MRCVPVLITIAGFLLLNIARSEITPAPLRNWSASAAGREFLAGLIDREVGLLPEFAGHHVFWLYHDNYLAAKVLDRTHPDEAAAVRKGMAKFGISRSGKIELLFGEGQLPLHRHELRDVARVGARTIRSEFTIGELITDPERYADLLLFTAIAEPDASNGRAAFAQAMAMWDGVGFKDEVFGKSKQYATYKLGLALLACAKFPDASGNAPAIRSRLLTLQSPPGGWITDYHPDGKPNGQANVETTCLAILGLEAGGLPDKCDLRPEFARWGLRQRSQGGRNTCSVFSVVETTEFALAKLTGRGRPLSVEFANWAANACTGRRDDGDFFHNILRGIETHGICEEAAMPYAAGFNGEAAPTPDAVKQAAVLAPTGRIKFHWLKGWSKTPGLDDADMSRIKSVLAGGNPISMGSWHSVVFTGYEDAPSQPGGGRFFIADSNLRETEISYQAARERFCDMLWVSIPATAAGN